VRIVTRAGRRVHLYWAPDADPAAVTRFEDGTCLHGALAVVATEPLPRASASLEPRRLSRSPRVTASGSTVIESLGHAWRFDQVEQSGTITALDRAAFTVDVVGLRQAPVGERLCINPGGRARSYRIESARPLAEGLRLQLDVTSVLGRARVAAVDGCDIELDAFLVTRTAYLRRARLQRETDDAWQVIDHAANRDGFSTVVRLASPLSEAEPGQWVAAVDYVVGDAVTLTPARRGEAP
jgi:hypothetical protein